jgi:sulfur transfer complex TusBCD TusB component (DsrH family)
MFKKMHKNKMNNKCNALNTDVAQRGEINEQHQNVIEPIVQKDLIVLSTIHQETP